MSVKPAVGASGAQMMAHLPLRRRQPLLHRPLEEPVQQPPHVIEIVLVVHAVIVTFPLGSLGRNRHFAIPMPCSPPLLTTLTEPNSVERQRSLRVWEGAIGCSVDVAVLEGHMNQQCTRNFWGENNGCFEGDELLSQ